MFDVAVGDVPAPVLLIANVSGSDQTVDVFIGTSGVVGTGKYTTRLVDHGIWRVDISDADKNSHIVVVSQGFLVVQLVSDDGQRVSAVTCLPRH